MIDRGDRQLDRQRERGETGSPLQPGGPPFGRQTDTCPSKQRGTGTRVEPLLLQSSGLFLRVSLSSNAGRERLSGRGKPPHPAPLQSRQTEAPDPSWAAPLKPPGGENLPVTMATRGGELGRDPPSALLASSKNPLHLPASWQLCWARRVGQSEQRCPSLQVGPTPGVPGAPGLPPVCPTIPPTPGLVLPFHSLLHQLSLPTGSPRLAPLSDRSELTAGL